MGIEYYLIAIPIDIVALWIGIRGVKVLAYAMKTGHVTKNKKGDFFEDMANSLLIFLGALFYFPASIYLMIALIYNFINN